MNPLSIDALVRAGLQEDLASGDLSSEATVPKEQRATGVAIAKSELVVCGAELFFAAFRQLDTSVSGEELLGEGTRANPGQVLWRVEGNTRSLLSAERTALNFAQLASGVATLTRRYVDLLPPGSRTRICDTRKTLPGLRQLQRHAVRVGGGHNHRDNLGAAVLLKENHIWAAGGVSQAIGAARRHAPHTSRIEIEVANPSQIDEAVSAGADVIMLDNFADDSLEQAVHRIAGRAIVEVSGGVTEARIAKLAAAGVDVISVGRLTHSAPAADISFLLR